MTNTDPQGESASGNPDVDELREQIDHTRDELAQTVEALAAKADVKGRAKDKAAELSAQAKDKAAELSAQAKERAATAKEQAVTAAAQAKEQAASATAQAKERAAAVAAQAKHTAQHGSQVAQEKTGEAREKLPTTVRDQPVILLAAGGVGLIVLLSWLARRLTR